MQLQNDRIYRKAYHDSKSQVHIPVDAMSVQAAKDCQTLVSDIDYRQYLHQWTCLPDQNDVIHARKAYDLQSDVSENNCRKALWQVCEALLVCDCANILSNAHSLACSQPWYVYFNLSGWSFPNQSWFQLEEQK